MREGFSVGGGGEQGVGEAADGAHLSGRCGRRMIGPDNDKCVGSAAEVRTGGGDEGGKGVWEAWQWRLQNS
jgi:hypothetical protein